MEKSRFSSGGFPAGKFMSALAFSALFLALFIPASAAPTQSGGATEASVSQQGNVKVKGKVLDEAGEPVIGAGIVQKGNASNGTVSDYDGNFELSIPADAVLSVSCIGYASQDVAVGGRTSISVILSEDARLLEESVVVGYGVQKKINLTGSVATIDLEDESSRPITDITSAMNGVSPGLQIMQSSGQPLSEGNSITIRGIGTLNTSSPLILVDGMEMDLSSVNPADVANISVLKDAASCAIYGNRGANGVILVTTKGGGEGKTIVTFDANFSINTPLRKHSVVSDYATYMELYNESCENIGNSAVFSQSSIDTWNAAKADPNGTAASGYPNYVAYPNTNMYDWVFDNNVQQKYTVSISGKEKKTGYNLSFSFIDNPGIMDNTGYSRFMARANVYSDVTPWLRFGTRTSGSVTDLDVQYDISSMLSGYYMLKTTPAIYPYYDGMYGAVENTEDDQTANNTLKVLNSYSGYQSNQEIYTNWYAQLKFLQHFQYDFNVYYSDDRTEKKYVNASVPTYYFSMGEYASTGSNPDDMVTAMTYTRTDRVKMNHIVNYNQTFGDHDVSAMVGYEQEKYYYRESYASKMSLTDASITDFDAATTPYETTGYGTEYRSQAVFGRVNYSYKGKYLFEADLRYDGSSRFSPDYRWGFFPSFSAGWRITEENFMKSIDWLSNLKLRVSWGELGNNAVGNYAWQSTYSTANYVIGGDLTSGIRATSLANYSLEWESTTVTNIGINFGVFNDKLTGDIDVYNKVTDGILYAPDMHLVMGTADAATQNIAEVTNKGIELQLNWKGNIGKDFQYGVTGQFSYNKNEVSEYLGTLEEGWEDDEWTTNIGDVSTGSTTRIIEGHMINEYYLLNLYKGTGTYYNSDGSVNPNGGPKDGMIRTEEDLAWVEAMIDAGYSFQPNGTVSESTLWYGDYIYADENGDGIYGSSYDYTFQGTSKNPKYNFGLTFEASYKNFDFSMVWGGSAGFSIYYYTTGVNSSSTMSGYAIPTSVANDHYFYDPTNPSDSRTNTTSSRTRLVNNTSGQNTATSSAHLEKGDFLKLRNLTFGYTLPSSLTRKFFVDKLRVYFSGENLLLLTGFPDVDPEQRSATPYSSMRQYSFGLNVTF